MSKYIVATFFLRHVEVEIAGMCSVQNVSDSSLLFVSRKNVSCSTVDGLDITC